MKKAFNLCMRAAIFFAASCTYSSVSAQTVPVAATQQAKLKLGKVIAMGFLSGTGEVIDIFFPNGTEAKNGKESPAQKLVVKTNEVFNVTVSTMSATFTYKGGRGRNPIVPVAGIIKVKVKDNETGGAGESEYTDLTNTPINLINEGKSGDAQAFSVQFKAVPGTEMPAGIYEIALLYTATPI